MGNPSHARALYGVVILGIILGNVYNWWIWVEEGVFIENLQNGTCYLPNVNKFVPGLKLGHTYPPLIGHSWTDVPCHMDVEVKDSAGTPVFTGADRAVVVFTFRQQKFEWNF